MYYTKFLVDALDNVMESAACRLNEAELKLLTSIRDSLASYEFETDWNARDEEAEKNFDYLVKFIIIIEEYIDKFL